MDKSQIEKKIETLYIDLKYLIINKIYPTSDDYIKILATQMIIDVNKQLNWNLNPDDIKIIEELIKASYIDMKKTINYGEYKLSDIIKKSIEKALSLFPRHFSFYTENKEKIINIIDSLFRSGQFKSYYIIKEGYNTYLKELTKTNNYKIVNYLVTYRAYKQVLVKKLFSITPELASLNLICLNNITELRNLLAKEQNTTRNFILTYRPFSFPKLNIRTDFIYVCSEDINYVKKAKIEKNLFENSILFEMSCISQVQSALNFIKEQEKFPNPTFIQIGYWVSAKKLNNMQKLHKCFNSKFPVKFIPLDMRYPLRRFINGFLHKITDAGKNLDDPYNLMRLENFDMMTIKNKEIIFFDNPKIIEHISNRISFHEKLTEIIESESFDDELEAYFEKTPIHKRFSIRLPEQIIINPNKDTPAVANYRLLESGIKYPVIVKTKAACYTKNSHFMGVGLDAEGFIALENHPIFRKEEHIVQQLVDHDELLLKIYVLGEKIFLFQKQSLPIKSKEVYGTSHFFFDSQKPFSECAALKDQLNFTEIPEIINKNIMLLITKYINEHMGLTIYGIDLIREKKTGDYYILDLNYFPDFKAIENFDELLREYLWNSYNQKKQKQALKRKKSFDLV